jgi:hypothetical protein
MQTVPTERRGDDVNPETQRVVVGEKGRRGATQPSSPPRAYRRWPVLAVPTVGSSADRWRRRRHRSGDANGGGGGVDRVRRRRQSGDEEGRRRLLLPPTRARRLAAPHARRSLVAWPAVGPWT